MSSSQINSLIGAAKLRALLEEKDKIIPCPGVYDGITARIALKVGFECLYMTGAGTTMSRLGIADLGVATLNDMRENASMIANLDLKVPLIADADTGYGGPIMVGRTVAQYMAAGVAGLHLEDQVVNKRCGHLLNKELVSEEVYLSRIRAAVNMRKSLPGDIVIIARTDALQSLGFDVAVSRLKKAIEIGADVAFLEGITSKEECRKVCSVLAPTPVLYNMVHGSVSPQISVTEGREFGFKIMIFPLLAVGAVIESVTRTANALKEQGEIPVQVESAHPRNAFRLCGLEEAMEFDRAAGGNSFSGGA